MIYSAILALAAFMVSLLGTKLLILRLRSSKVFADIPNERSSHNKPVPKGGGIALITTLFIFLFASDSGEYVLLLAMVILACVSLLDDIVSMNPLAR